MGDLGWTRPGAPVVHAAPKVDLDLAPVRHCELPCLAVGKHCAACCHHHPRDAVQNKAVGLLLEEGDLFQEGCRIAQAHRGHQSGDDKQRIRITSRPVPASWAVH
ncbi:MAG: hypothetical protein ACYSWW_07965 [Planctomycetota bacterium]